MSRDNAFQDAARELGHSFDGEIKAGGNYLPLTREGDTVYLSGQVPRVGSTIVVTGRVGAEVDLAGAQLAAKICAMRALALLQRSLGSLDGVKQVLRMNVFVQCADTFTQHSEVADAASDLLVRILGPAGTHARTSVGVYALPKNASVELDLTVAVAGGAAPTGKA
ncbi:RidA family protein [Mitsuaria sp. GD03876]|uniref:RidA family protein n=1 Tax=Mitsuaria sp. GD03876 TaxID=2975399 RepID=UPI002447C609|nr:RidA family protein [Mitsuaria sp. GD03876]MDH0865484.1 RidA family protein [Mitsuaria sp. GD03876]